MRKRPLTAAFVAAGEDAGTLRRSAGSAGSTLYLRVRRMKSGRVSKSWSQRIRVGGKPTNLGLGSYAVVTLKESRAKAFWRTGGQSIGATTRETRGFPPSRRPSRRSSRSTRRPGRTLAGPGSGVRRCRITPIRASAGST